MSNRFPPWLVVPMALIGAVAATWVVGAVQSKSGSAAEPTVLDHSSDVSPSDASANDDSDPARHPLFPDFSAPTAAGPKFSLGDYKGKVVLVNFWATWCGPCKMEIPDLIALQTKYGARGFTVVGLSEDEQFSKASAFAKEAGMNYPVVKTPDGLSAKVGVSALPMSVLIGKDGKVISVMSGVDPSTSMASLWEPQIEKVL